MLNLTEQSSAHMEFILAITQNIFRECLNTCRTGRVRIPHSEHLHYGIHNFFKEESFLVNSCL